MQNRIKNIVQIKQKCGISTVIKKIKQCQPHNLKAVLVGLGAEGITYSVILHCDTISGEMCKKPHLNVEPIKNYVFGPCCLAF